MLSAMLSSIQRQETDAGKYSFRLSIIPAGPNFLQDADYFIQNLAKKTITKGFPSISRPITYRCRALLSTNIYLIY
jgi:hypothetical protein